MQRRLMNVAFILLGLAFAQPTLALDPQHQKDAQDTIGKAVAFLRGTQSPDGSWTPQPGPAITGLVVTALLDEPDIDPDDPAVAKAITYILDRVQEDGSIRDGADGILANYNTAICVSALARVHNNPDAAAAVKGGQAFLKGIQWKVGMTTPDGETITEDHPFLGGAGYGNHGRPDMSNTQFMLQALFDSGVDCNDPAFKNAITFISRCQAIESNTFFPEGTLINDGSMIYSTSISKDLVGVPESKANPDMMDEAKTGATVSGLRGYGSITYAGFKSYLYAELDRDDPRVTAALDWLQSNYTLEQNPGMPESHKLQGLYYYYVTQARALAAWGSTFLDLADGTKVDWANNLIAKLASMQAENGSFTNEADRWMEGDPNLVTAYSIIALQQASR